MFDLLQLGLPCGIEAHGKRWVALYRVHGDSDDGVLYLAAEEIVGQPGRVIPPAPLHLVCVPHTAAVLEARRKAKEGG